MRIDRTRSAETMLHRRHEQLVNDRKLPLSVRQMISAHMFPPWISEFWSVALRPVSADSKIYLDFQIGTAEDASWYFPSAKWWLAHAHASHPPDGTGCDVAAHVSALTSEGDAPAFDYATITRGGQLSILRPEDFEKECAWWRSRR